MSLQLSIPLSQLSEASQALRLTSFFRWAELAANLRHSLPWRPPQSAAL